MSNGCSQCCVVQCILITLVVSIGLVVCSKVDLAVDCVDVAARISVVRCYVHGMGSLCVPRRSCYRSNVLTLLGLSRFVLLPRMARVVTFFYYTYSIPHCYVKVKLFGASETKGNVM